MTNVRLNIDDMYEPEPNSGCWLWLGAIDRQGYGRLASKGAHRIFYERDFGAVQKQHYAGRPIKAVS